MTTDAALEVAVRALRHRDRTTAQLERHLVARGFAPVDVAAVLGTLARTGILDDARYAENRAAALADRAAGDAFIAHDLRAAGVPDDAIEAALALVVPERERAARVVRRRGASPKTARYLAGKGFSEDSVGAAVAHAVGEG